MEKVAKDPEVKRKKSEAMKRIWQERRNKKLEVNKNENESR